MIVTLEYGVAKGLFLGKLSPAVTIINQRVKAQVVNGFRHWPRIASHSIVTVNRILKIARRVPTVFAPVHP